MPCNNPRGINARVQFRPVADRLTVIDTASIIRTIPSPTPPNMSITPPIATTPALLSTSAIPIPSTAIIPVPSTSAIPVPSTTTSIAIPPASTSIIAPQTPTPLPPPSLSPTPSPTPTSTGQPHTDAPATTLTTQSPSQFVIESTLTSIINNTPTTITLIITSTNQPNLVTTSGTATHVTTTSPGAGAGGATSGNSAGGGLSGPALIAVAVIVPVFTLAIVAIVLILYFKKKRRSRNNVLVKGGVMDGAVAPEEGRDGTYEMDSADNTGYRGWGSTAGGQKTTIAGSNSAGYPISSSVGNTVSDGGYNNSAGTGSPGYLGNVSELYSGVNTPSSPVYPDSIGLLAAGRVAPSPAFTEASTMGVMPSFDSGGGLNRGISNASSNYSAVTHSDQSDYDRGQPHYYGPDVQEYDAAYFSNGSNMYYDPSNPPPVIRDVEARRNTRIETPTSPHSPQHGSSGIAQNF